MSPRHLTPRQEQIVELVCGPRRLSYPKVAAELGISPNTILSHIEKIRERLDARDTEARVAMNAYYRKHIVGKAASWAMAVDCSVDTLEEYAYQFCDKDADRNAVRAMAHMIRDEINVLRAGPRKAA